MDTVAFGNTVKPLITEIVTPVVGILFGIGVVVFIWGIIEMIINGESAEAREKGRMHMLGGIIGMVIMLSAWGIIHLISNTLMTLK